ncbi:unnamed protein product [Lymnaea stagnalis]|uniref:Uncharacterized protein n=1 Tax=Lymnaea stagnalis TaxID=6523 RepID=A0AAV2HHG9_LYMST
MDFLVFLEEAKKYDLETEQLLSVWEGQSKVAYLNSAVRVLELDNQSSQAAGRNVRENLHMCSSLELQRTTDEGQEKEAETTTKGPQNQIMELMKEGFSKQNKFISEQFEKLQIQSSREMLEIQSGIIKINEEHQRRLTQSDQQLQLSMTEFSSFCLKQFEKIESKLNTMDDQNDKKIDRIKDEFQDLDARMKSLLLKCTDEHRVCQQESNLTLGNQIQQLSQTVWDLREHFRTVAAGKRLGDEEMCNLKNDIIQRIQGTRLKIPSATSEVMQDVVEDRKVADTRKETMMFGSHQDDRSEETELKKCCFAQQDDAARGVADVSGGGGMENRTYQSGVWVNPGPLRSNLRDVLVHPGLLRSNQSDVLVHPGPMSLNQIDLLFQPGPLSSNQRDSLVHPGQLSSNQSDVLVKPGPMSSDQSDVLVNPGPLSSDQSDVFVNPGPMSSDQNDVLVNPGPLSSDQSDVLVNPGPLSSNQSDVLVNPGPLSSDQSDVLVNPGPLSSDQSDVLVNSGPLSSDQNDVLVNPGPLSSDQSDVIASPGPLSSDQIDVIANPGPLCSDQNDVLVNPGPLSSDQSDVLVNPGPLSSDQSDVIANPGPLSSDQSDVIANPGPLSSDQSDVIANPGPLSSDQSDVIANPGPLSSDQSDVIANPGPLCSDQSDVLVNPGPLSSDQSDVLVKPSPLNSDQSDALFKPGPLSSDQSDVIANPGPLSSDRSDALANPGPLSSDQSDALTNTLPDQSDVLVNPGPLSSAQTQQGTVDKAEKVIPTTPIAKEEELLNPQNNTVTKQASNEATQMNNSTVKTLSATKRPSGATTINSIDSQRPTASKCMNLNMKDYPKCNARTERNNDFSPGKYKMPTALSSPRTKYSQTKKPALCGQQGGISIVQLTDLMTEPVVHNKRAHQHLINKVKLPDLNYFPEKGAEFCINGACDFVSNKSWFYTDYLYTQPKTTKVRLKIAFSDEDRIQVRLCVSRCPQEVDCRWPVYFIGAGKICNHESKKYTQLWKFELQECGRPEPGAELELNATVCLLTSWAHFKNVRYSELTTRKYESDDQFRFLWTLTAH